MKFKLFANTGSQLSLIDSTELSVSTLSLLESKGYQLSVESGQNALYASVRVSELVLLLANDAIDLMAVVQRTCEDGVPQLNGLEQLLVASQEVARVLYLMDQHHAATVEVER